MSKILVIVESSGKIKKIEEYLGSDYIVKASFGHCLDLDPKTLSIDIENNYKPYYIIKEDKQKLVNELKKLSKSCSEVILASDIDREGEFIASSLSELLDLKKPKRITFTEITKKAIQDAIKNPKLINKNMVESQQTRRLLDRLVGYKITPILWKYMNSQTTHSAGRVQSVVLKIIKDKEDEIMNSINNLYIKSEVFLLKDKIKIHAILSDPIYKSIDQTKSFIESINKKTIFKITNIDNKDIIRKPSPPFITSTLQQDASTKLKFNVKKTMDIAQKLYESGLITYMRTDSINISDEAIKGCEIYIIKEYGLEYSNPTKYKSAINSQEAHECIRCTNINLKTIEDKDQNKLYELIWKRTIASQMSPAQIFLQNITIKSNNKENEFKYSYLSKNETINFKGYLIVYNDSEEEENYQDKLDIKVNDILKFNNLKISEEYTKSPLRYNEANLIKFLEKNNIGRPSTYVSIIHKNIERNYIEIQNIDGLKKESATIEMDKKYIIKESTKEIIIGKENQKMVLTEMGLKVVTFMIEKFEPIMKLSFTSEFEEYLDKIEEGKAKWFNILDKFYKVFASNLEQPITNNIILGLDPNTNQEIYIGSGKYGPYIKVGENFFPIDNPDTITLSEAINLLKYPKYFGKIDKKNVSLCNGKYGLYIKHGTLNISIPNDKKEEEIDLEYIKTLILSKDKYAIHTFQIKDKIINVKNGQYGHYIQIISKNSKKNVPIPKDYNIENINLKDVLEIISNKK